MAPQTPLLQVPIEQVLARYCRVPQPSRGSTTSDTSSRMEICRGGAWIEPIPVPLVPSPLAFEIIVDKFLLNRHPTKRAKEFIWGAECHKVYSSIRGKGDGLDSQKRHWAKGTFSIDSVKAPGKLFAKKASGGGEGLVCTREEIYLAIARAHLTTGHKARDPTWKELNKLISHGVPKEVVGEFVRNCPGCHGQSSKKRSQASGDSADETIDEQLERYFENPSSTQTFEDVRCPDEGRDPSCRPSFVTLVRGNRTSQASIPPRSPSSALPASPQAGRKIATPKPARRQIRPSQLLAGASAAHHHPYEQPTGPSATLDVANASRQGSLDPTSLDVRYHTSSSPSVGQRSLKEIERDMLRSIGAELGYDCLTNEHPVDQSVPAPISNGREHQTQMVSAPIVNPAVDLQSICLDDSLLQELTTNMDWQPSENVLPDYDNAIADTLGDESAQTPRPDSPRSSLFGSSPSPPPPPPSPPTVPATDEAVSSAGGISPPSISSNFFLETDPENWILPQPAVPAMGNEPIAPANPLAGQEFLLDAGHEGSVWNLDDVNIDFNNVDVNNVDFNFADFNNVDFNNVDFSNFDFPGAGQMGDQAVP
ncbi:MAG: hypothetical protein M1814_005829 [Vezdaea aestivalis]|nr:MAG: hypothetical protein M1814_005829 [Vezdaea aestivalis]